MNIFVCIKSAGKRRPALNDIPYNIPDHVTTLRSFLTELVGIEVEKYNKKESSAQVLPLLTQEEIESCAEMGKIGFGSIYSEKKADRVKAVENAIQCFEDGLVRVFQNEMELKRLDEPVQIQEGDRFMLIRLTFLAGRLW